MLKITKFIISFSPVRFMAGAVAINFQNLRGFRIAQLIPVIATNKAAITWARANGLLANQMQCSSLQCMDQNRPMHEVPDGKQVDGDA